MTRQVPNAERLSWAAWSYDSRSILVGREGLLTRMDPNGGFAQQLQLPSQTGMPAWAKEGIVAETGGTLQFFEPDGSGIREFRNPSEAEFSGADGVVCDDGRFENGMSSMSPSLFGQEMGHAYGLMHSCADGSEDPYKDPWDKAKQRWLRAH
jgi:hypothetical protein